MAHIPKRFEQVTEAIASIQDDLSREYYQILVRLSTLDVWSLDSRVQGTLAGLFLVELTGSGAKRMLSTLSQSQSVRLELAAVLITRPEVLILDEPTNHLDR